MKGPSSAVQWSAIFCFEMCIFCREMETEEVRSRPSVAPTSTADGERERMWALGADFGQNTANCLYETRDDATRLAAPAAAGPAYRARRTAEGIASLAPRRHRASTRTGSQSGSRRASRDSAATPADRGDHESGLGCQHGGRHSRALLPAPVYTLVLQGQHAANTGRRRHGATKKTESGHRGTRP